MTLPNISTANKPYKYFDVNDAFFDVFKPSEFNRKIQYCR